MGFKRLQRALRLALCIYGLLIVFVNGIGTSMMMPLLLRASQLRNLLLELRVRGEQGIRGIRMCS